MLNGVLKSVLEEGMIIIYFNICLSVFTALRKTMGNVCQNVRSCLDSNLASYKYETAVQIACCSVHPASFVVCSYMLYAVIHVALAATLLCMWWTSPIQI